MSYLTKKDLLALSQKEVRTELSADSVDTRLLTEPEVRHIVEAFDAFWLHAGDPKQPHVVLTSGRCSNGYVNLRPVLDQGNLCHLFGRQIVLLAALAGHANVDMVIGSYKAAVGLARSASIWLDCKFDFTVRHVLPDGTKTQVWDSDRLIGRHERVLHIEELVTTDGTARQVREGVRQKHDWPVCYAPVIPVIVHRSQSPGIEDSKFVWLAHYDIGDWLPEECPLCAAGSQRLKPKEGNNWARLTGR